MDFCVIIILLQNYGLVKDKVIFDSGFKVLKIKRIFSIFFFTLVAFFGMAGLVFAADPAGLDYAAKTGLGNTDPIVIAAKIIQVVLGFLGIVAVGLIIYAGFLWMTSNGSEERVERAKAIIKNAAIGLIIILSSFAIATFILNKLLGNEDVSIAGTSSSNNSGTGIGALGAGILQSVYPEPYQKEVPRNTSIVVTFREAMDPATICQATGAKCSGENIVKENIRVYKTSQGDSCQTDCGQSNVTEVKVYTNDNKTFVFMPSSYLGSPSEYIWYSVDLGADIKKSDGSLAFQSFDNGYGWSFEVSSKLDLTPPQVVSGGLFPVPDNEMDDVGSTNAAVAATGSITVSGQPQVYVQAKADSPSAQGGSEQAALEGTYNCQADGTISASISSSMTVNVSGVSGVVGGDGASDGKVSLGCGLVLSASDGTFTAGNSWTIAVVAEKQADTLIVGKNLYTFTSSATANDEITVGANTGVTATNIKNALASHSDLNASASGNVVSLTAKVAGKSGNDIALSTASDALMIATMSGGKDKEDTSTTKDKKDKPRNTVIQINFDEAVNPMQVSGTSEELAGYIRVVNLATDENVPGKFIVSNQYKTVEFISNNECGRNACGEKIYCLPENSQLKVELVAANLSGCAGNDDCASKSPYNICGTNGICQESTTSTNFPMASTAFDGIMDMALNSLDGNRNSNAQGPAGFYNENTADTGEGDSFKWSFFISDKIDLDPPLINSTNAANNATGINLSSSVSVNFNKVMMSGSLATGEAIINNGKEDITHKLVNLWSFSSQPIGYWISNKGVDDSPADGEADWTEAFINHTDFADATKYRAQVGSGVKDIYQNCFKPCDGPACTGENDSNPSCCSGALSNVDGVIDQCAQ